VREAKRHDADAFHRLRSVPRIGKVLPLTILYEIHDITPPPPSLETTDAPHSDVARHEEAGTRASMSF